MTTTTPRSGDLTWLTRGNCTQTEDTDARRRLLPFFVEAGRPISDATKAMCRTCPVLRECTVHAFTGGRDGTPIAAGFLAARTPTERRGITLEQALEALDDPPEAYETPQLF